MRAPPDKRNPGAVRAAAGASDLIEADNFGRSEITSIPSEIQPPSTGGNQGPGPIIRRHWPADGLDGWRPLGDVVDGLLSKISEEMAA